MITTIRSISLLYIVGLKLNSKTMYHLRKHRTLYYVFFADKQLSEGMWQQQAIAKLQEMLYDTEI